MTPDMWIALAILFTAIVLFITEWIRLDIVALGVVLALMLTNLLTVSEAFSGFSNSSVITILFLFFIGGAVMQTGLAGLIGRRILRIAGTNEVRLLVVIMVAVALLSGVMSNTGTVAVLLPAIVALARSAGVPAGKLLIPLAFGSSLGGAMTLIGTPPNLIVSDLLKESGFEPFGFFAYTPIGALLLVVGIVYMVFVGRRLLPNRTTKTTDLQRVDSPEELISLYRLPENMFRLRVRRSSTVVGKTVADVALSHNYGVTILEILRPTTPRPVMKFGEQELILQSKTLETLTPTIDGTLAETELKLDDILVVQGDGRDVAFAAAELNVGIQAAQQKDTESLINDEAGVAEIVLPPRSSLLGKTVTDLRFGSRYKLTLLGINRPGRPAPLDPKKTTLQFGDTLLVQGAWQNIFALKSRRRDFVVMGQPESMLGAPNKAKAPIALIILLVMIGAMVFTDLSVVTVSVAAALAMILTGCLSMDDAYDAVDWKSIILIAGMLPMAIALEKVGLVDVTANGLTAIFSGAPPSFILGGLFLVTAVFTQVLSNTATTVLIAPIALATAANLNASPYPFLMTVAVAASMAFASPVASPVNTLVMGAGNYRFSDYMKVGVPLMGLMLVITVLVMPLFFQF